MGVEADATPPPQSAPPRRPSDGRRGRPPTSSRGPRGIGVGCVPSCSARVEPSDTVGVSENQERDAKRSRRGPPAPATAARPKAIPPPPFVPPACPPPQMTESAILCLHLPSAGRARWSMSTLSLTSPLGSLLFGACFRLLGRGREHLGRRRLPWPCVERAGPRRRRGRRRGIKRARRSRRPLWASPSPKSRSDLSA